MKWNVLSWSAAVAWLCVSTFSQPAERMRSTPQTPDDVEKLSAECEKGQLASCTALGIDYLDGRGVTKDENKARALLERACGGNDARGCNNLGIIYAEGLSVPKDGARAVQLYQRGCDGGYLRACMNLGRMYSNGRGAPKDEARAVQLFRKVCESGSVSVAETMITAMTHLRKEQYELIQELKVNDDCGACVTDSTATWSKSCGGRSDGHRVCG